MQSFIPNVAIASLLLSAALPAVSDTTEARCDVYPKGEDRATSTGACQFSQRQGFVSIQWPDGKRYELSPSDDVAGNYDDQHGKRAYRQSGLGPDGLIFRMATESVYVYWDASTLQAMDSPRQGTASMPYSTSNYDATAILSCSFGQPAHDSNCPAGIMRGDAGSASIRIMKPDGQERILNFDGGNVTTSDDGSLKASQHQGDWHIRIDDYEFFVVPEAAIFGG